MFGKITEIGVFLKTAVITILTIIASALMTGSITIYELFIAATAFLTLLMPILTPWIWAMDALFNIYNVYSLFSQR